MNDILLNKKESIEHCIKQIRVYYALHKDTPFEKDYLKQDAIAINLQRVCELAIDMANHIIKIKKLGLPKESKESFELLEKSGIIPEELADNLGKMVGFRNVLIHEYKKIDLKLMVDVIENHLDDLVKFTNMVLEVS
ncbi:DUF86 domain-containing protein [bacterium]|nr:DUF86 domain-containing protein [bacterium]